MKLSSIRMLVSQCTLLHPSLLLDQNVLRPAKTKKRPSHRLGPLIKLRRRKSVAGKLGRTLFFPLSYLKASAGQSAMTGT